MPLRSLWSLLLVFCVCACTRMGTDVDQGAKPMEIAFESPVVGLQTKTTGEIGSTYDIHEDFLVSAWYSPSALTRADGTTNGSTANGIAFFDLVKAFHTGSNLAHTDFWRLTPAYYWPKADGYLTFHCLSPESLRAQVSHTWGNGFRVSGFAMADDPADQIDLLYSDYIFNKRRSDYDNGDPYDDPTDTQAQKTAEDPYVYNGVNVSFRHGLSSIHFKVREADDYEVKGARIRIFLRKLELLNVYNTGDFSENRAPDVTTNAFSSDSRPLWGHFTSEQDYTLYNSGTLTGDTRNPLSGDIRMMTNGTWHVARNLSFSKGMEIVFRRNGSWEEVLGHIRGQVPPYIRGEEFSLTDEGGTDINILAGGTYDILLNPSEKKARIIEAQPASYYTAFDEPSEWGIHTTEGFKMNTTAYDLTQKDPCGNFYIGGYSLLAIPQPLSHTDAAKWDATSTLTGNTVQVRIKFCIKYGDVEVEDTVTRELSTLSETQWLPGKRYLYTLTLGMDKVILDPYVTAWDDYTDIGITPAP